MAPINFVVTNFVGLPPTALDNLIARLKSGSLPQKSYRYSLNFLEHIAKEGTFTRNLRLAIVALSVYFTGSLFGGFCANSVTSFPTCNTLREHLSASLPLIGFGPTSPCKLSYFAIDWWSRFSGADYDLASRVQGWAEIAILVWMLFILHRAATPLHLCLGFPDDLKTFTFNRMVLSLFLVNIVLFTAVVAVVPFLK